MAAVQFVVVSQGMSQVDANGLIDLSGPGVILGHQLLDHLQLLSGAEALIQLNARPGGQLNDAVLREIFHSTADVI